MSLDTSTKRTTGGINHRLNRCHSKAVQAMNATYYVSYAPTNKFIIQQGQGQIGYCFDHWKMCKSVQIAPTKWLVWNFDERYIDLDKDQFDDLALHVNPPAFLRVGVLDVSKNLGKQFVKCSCKKVKHQGHPCKYLFV